MSPARPDVTLIGLRDEPAHYALRDLLTRAAQPHTWLDADSDEARAALETSLPGFFAAGDVRHGSTKRVAGAVGEGAMAVALAHLRLEELAAVRRPATASRSSGRRTTCQRPGVASAGAPTASARGAASSEPLISGKVGARAGNRRRNG